MITMNLKTFGVLTNPAAPHYDSLLAGDQYDRRLLENVHPADWVNPTLAITTGQKISALASMIQPYPTQAEILKRIGDVYMRGKLTPGVKKIFSKWLSWRRR